MFKHFKTTLIALGWVLALTGCIHKDYPPCAPLQVKLVVADKNYSNVSIVETEDPVDENLPFHCYVPTMCYILRNAETGEIVETSGLVQTTNENLNQTITFPEDLPFGKYDMIVWGGIKSLDALEFDNDPSTAAFHTGSDSDEDIYLGHATIDFKPLETEAELQLKRTMGKLNIIKELQGKAEGVNRSQKVLTDVISYVDMESNYNGKTNVTFNNSFPYSPSVVTKTVVAPTPKDGTSRIHMEFYNDTPHSPFPVLIPKDLDIQILPNEVTEIKYRYDPAIEDFDVYVKSYNGWEQINQLELKD